MIDYKGMHWVYKKGYYFTQTKDCQWVEHTTDSNANTIYKFVELVDSEKGKSLILASLDNKSFIRIDSTKLYRSKNQYFNWRFDGKWTKSSLQTEATTINSDYENSTLTDAIETTSTTSTTSTSTTTESTTTTTTTTTSTTTTTTTTTTRSTTTTITTKPSKIDNNKVFIYTDAIK